jgi:hypothetical protein
VRFATDDRVTVTDPAHWNYGERGVVTDVEPDDDFGGQRLYVVTLAKVPAYFTVEQLDFTEEETKA